MTPGAVGFSQELRARARARDRRLVFPEGEDVRVQAAAVELGANKLARPTLLGSVEEIRTGLKGLGASGDGIEVIDPEMEDRIVRYAETLHDLRRHRGVTDSEARALVRDPLLQGALMVHLGEADGSVAGCVRTTGDVILAGLWGVGADDGIETVSSAFYMVFPEGHPRASEVLTFTDAGVVPKPTPRQLAEIAVAAARSRRLVVGDEPRVAFLSYSTLGSSDGPSIEPVREAAAMFRTLMPGVTVEGEMQADAALNQDVAIQKAPKSAILGDANVLVFPDLNAANIAYKLTEQLGGAQALGPVLQGLRRPCNDLSRGAKVDDIVAVACITSLMAP